MCGTVISKVAATFDFLGLSTSIIPNQSFESSVDLQTGHILPVVRALHFLHATSFTNTDHYALITLLSFVFFSCLRICRTLFVFCIARTFVTSAGITSLSTSYFFFYPLQCTQKWLPTCYTNLTHGCALS